MTTNNPLKDAVGYVWKLEYGPEKGYHMHLLVFFDGSMVRKDQALAYLIGKYWSGEHTVPKGEVSFIPAMPTRVIMSCLE